MLMLALHVSTNGSSASRALTFYYIPLDFSGFQNIDVRDVEIPTLVGGAVLLECDFGASNPPPEVEWYSNGTTRVEFKLNQIMFYESRYLFIRALTTTQRMMRFHCQINNFQDEKDMPIRSPTTYTLNTDLTNVGITEYKGLGTKEGRIGETIRFLYAAGNRNRAGNFEAFPIECPPTPLATFSIHLLYIIHAMLTSEAENEDEVAFHCIVSNKHQIRGVIKVVSESRKGHCSSIRALEQCVTTPVTHMHAHKKRFSPLHLGTE